MTVVCLYSKRWDRKLNKLERLKKTNKHCRSKICGAAAIGWLWNLYILALDITALVVQVKADASNDLVVKEHKLFALSFIAVGFTGGGFLLFSVVFILLSLLPRLRYTFLALSMLGPTFAVIIHLPYMVIAFLNDAYYASSVFTFYTIATFVLFGALNFVIGTCQEALLHAEKHLFIIDKLTNISISPRISVNDGPPQEVQHQNAAKKVALHFKPGTQMETTQANVVRQRLSLTQLQFPQEQEPNNYNDGLTLTLIFGAAHNSGATSSFDCEMISNVHAKQESTKVNITVPRRVELTVTLVQHENNVILLSHLRKLIAQLTLSVGN